MYPMKSRSLRDDEGTIEKKKGVDRKSEGEKQVKDKQEKKKIEKKDNHSQRERETEETYRKTASWSHEVSRGTESLRPVFSVW